MKLKQGDLVQIKPNLKEFDRNEPPHITSEMLEDAGKLFTVEHVVKKYSSYSYKKISVKENPYTWRPKWLNEIKKVERKALEGEFVLITNAGASGCFVPEFDGKPAYKNGDILKIIRCNGNGNARFLDGRDDNLHEYVLYSSEYVVLEGYEDCDQVKKFEKQTYFTGKAVCIAEARHLSCHVIVGKIYEFKDGMCDTECGCHFTVAPVKSIDELNDIFRGDLKFIEVIE